MGVAAPGAQVGRVIELALEVPLASFVLRVQATLGSGFTAVMGPSGSGKTSLLEAIAGLRPKARGRIVVGGEVLLDTDRGRRVPPERRHVGYVPQDAGLFPHLTARGNVAFAARAGCERMATAIDMLELRDLFERYPVSLSGGERQRVALARSLASEPRVLLLDEPLAALDVGLRERILPYLMRIRDEWRVPVLYVTHNVGEALALAGEALLLREGRVEAVGPPLDLLSSQGVVRAAETGIENLAQGRVVSHDDAGGVTRVELATDLAVSIPLVPARAIGTVVTLAIRAEDIVVATERPHALSARNVFEARIAALERTGVDTTLRCAVGPGGRPWLVRLTPAAVAAMGLAEGRVVWLAVKSHSVRLV